MAISTRNDEADRLARELSDLTGETLTEAISQTLHEGLQRTRLRDAHEIRRCFWRL